MIGRKVSEMQRTEEQVEICDEAGRLGPGEALRVLAFSGTGKTTTLKGVAQVRRGRGLYQAFNKPIADEARVKLSGTGCDASTIHSIAYNVLRERIGAPVPANARAFMETGLVQRFHVPRLKGWGNYRVASAVSRSVAAFCNSADEQLTANHARAALVNSLGDPDTLPPGPRKERAEDALRAFSGVMTEMAQAYWDYSVERMDLSHDMYLKLLDLQEDLRARAFGRYDYLMIDEAQDINPVQLSIAIKTGLTLIAVGDPWQQIYSWRGAENALAKLPGKQLYLTQSFRFGEEIADVGRRILASRPDGGPEQRLTGVGPGPLDLSQRPRAAVICRTNAGVLEEALALAKQGRYSIRVINLDELLRDLRSAVALKEARREDVTSPAIKPYMTWEELVTEAEEGDSALARLVDIVDDGRVSEVESLEALNKTQPGDADIEICTGHRSKGLEYPAVKLGGDWRPVDVMTKRYLVARDKSHAHTVAALEEWNAFYVASTRAQARLRGHAPLLEPSVTQEARMAI